MRRSAAKTGRQSRRSWRQQYGLLAAQRQTRRPQALWDRLKFSVLFVGLWFVIVWYQMSTNPVLGFTDAARQQLQVQSGTGRWLALLLGLEVLRQLSYLLAEQWRSTTGCRAGSSAAAIRSRTR